MFACSAMTRYFYDFTGTNGSSSAPSLSEGDKETKSTDDDEKGALDLASFTNALLIIFFV